MARIARRQPAQRHASTSTPRWWSITPAPAARAASCSRPCSTARAAACSRARSSSRRTRRRPTRKMMTQALLLSDDAEADNKPELEIFADDVQLRPRRHRRRARRGPDVLSDGARHSGGRGGGAADPGLRRRGDRGASSTRASREALMDAVVGMAARRGRHEHASRGRATAPTTSTRIRADFPISGDAGLRQAAGLSRQRRLGAEAAGGARPA